MEGPKELRVGRSKQMMQWDIGYGKYGFGLTYRPRLELTYTIEPISVALFPKSIYTVSKKEVLEDVITPGLMKMEIRYILLFNLICHLFPLTMTL